MDKTLSLFYTFKPISYEKINDEFTLCRCYAMALGKNRNFSHFSKEAVQDAIPSLFNIPVVAHLKKRDDGGWYVGSHDSQIVIDDSGITVNDLTLPYGVVPESCNPEFVEITEKDGSKATYLVCSIILWTGRYPTLLDAKSQTDDEVYYNQSMEIEVFSWQALKDDKKYSDISKFIFSALCLLGRDEENPEYNTEPCFPSSRVEPYQFNLGDKFKQEFSLMKEELKKLGLNNQNQPSKLPEVDINKQSFSTSGEEEKKALNEKLELLTKFNLTVDTIDFKIDDLSLEELESKLNEKYGQAQNDELETRVSFSATYKQKRDAIDNALDSIVVRDADGNITEETYLWCEDFDDTYAYIEKSYWNANGDHERTYGRQTYSFDDSMMTAVITGTWEEMFLMRLTASEKQAIEDARGDYASIKSEFDSYKENYITLEADVEVLRTFQKDKLDAERKEAEDIIFEKFDKKIGDNEKYKTLKKNSNKYDLETLSKECFSILGEATSDITLNFESKNRKEFTKVVVETNFSEGDSPYYGGIIEKTVKSK